MTGIADMVTRSSSNAAEVARVAADMQRASESGARRNPRDRARRAARGPARASALRGRRDGDGRDARREDAARGCSISAAAARASPRSRISRSAPRSRSRSTGMRPLKGKVAWVAGGCFGVRFEPSMLEAGELLRITGSTRSLGARLAPAAPRPRRVRRRTTSRCSA